MPHVAVRSGKATTQNPVTSPEPPNDQAHGQHVTARPEPASYAAHDVRDATVAGPAAGELGEYADLDDPSGGMAQGRTNTNREAHAHSEAQGSKIGAANAQTARRASSDTESA